MPPEHVNKALSGSLLEEQSERGTRPKVLCMADQYGVCHAPFATARSFLTEHGYGDVSVLLHDNDGVLHTVTAAELLPALPLWGSGTACR